MLKYLFLRRVSITLAILSISLPSFGANLAEKLGFEKNAKLLIIHADDIGLSQSINEASFNALSKGIVTSGSVVTPSPWASDAARRFKQNSSLDLGVHANFTSEWLNFRLRPLADRNLVKSLIDPSGFFLASPEKIATQSNPADVENEITAQIEHALQLGLLPSHLDTHSAVMFTRKDFLDSYVKVARRFRLVPILPRLNPDTIAFMKSMELPVDDLKTSLENLALEGIATIDSLYLDPRTQTPATRAKNYREYFSQLKPGLSLVFTDLSEKGSELNALTSSVAEGNESLAPMFSDKEFFTNKKTKDFLKKLGIHLVTWRSIQKVIYPVVSADRQ